MLFIFSKVSNLYFALKDYQENLVEKLTQELLKILNESEFEFSLEES